MGIFEIFVKNVQNQFSIALCLVFSYVAIFFWLRKLYDFVALEKGYRMSYTRKMVPSIFEKKNVSKGAVVLQSHTM